MYSILKLGVALLLILSACGAKAPSHQGKKIRIVPVSRTPEPDTVSLHIVFPKDYENKKKQPINTQLRLEGFPLGTLSSFERAKEIYNDREGQAIHVFIDDHPYVAFNQAFEDSFDENRSFYDKIISFKFPFTISRGQHIIRVFPVRSYNESLKGSGCYDASVFYFQDRSRINDFNINLNGPYLTYNEPQGTFPESKASPILLDFYISNCQLSEDGYRVRVSINGKFYENLSQWTPYYIYGLSSGKHRIHLELIDKDNKTVPGLFNSTERIIEIN